MLAHAAIHSCAIIATPDMGVVDEARFPTTPAGIKPPMSLSKNARETLSVPHIGMPVRRAACGRGMGSELSMGCCTEVTGRLLYGLTVEDTGRLPAGVW